MYNIIVLYKFNFKTILINYRILYYYFILFKLLLNIHYF